MKKITKLLIACSLIGSFILTSCSSEPENNVVQPQDKNIVSITIKEGSVPDKIYVGEFDNAGIKLVLHYNDETTEEVDVTSAMLPAQYRDAIQTPGSYTVEIFYRKQLIKLKINIVPKDLTVNFYAYVDKNEYTLVDSQIIPYRHDAEAPNVVQDFYYDGIHYYYKNWDVKFSDVKVDTNVYAQYDEINFYNVTFFNGNGNIIDTQRIDEGQNATEPNEQMREVEGYTFVGWDRSYLNVRKDISVYGLYKKISSVKAATEISISGNKSIVVNKDYTCEFSCTTNSPDVDPKELIWTSSDPSVVSVENGEITAHNNGLARISVSNDYAKDTVTVLVAELGSKENPLSLAEAIALLDRAGELNAVVIQKMFVKATVSVRKSSYDESGVYRITFMDNYNIYSSGGSKISMRFDESLGFHNMSVEECTITFECWGSKANGTKYYFDYSPEGETEYPVIYAIEYPDVRELNTSSTEKVALSLNNTPDGYNYEVSISPSSAQMSQSISWSAENESIISLELLNEAGTKCKVTPLAIGQTKLVASYKEIQREFYIVVDDFGTEENPLTLAQLKQFSRNYDGYFCNAFVVEGQITKARHGSYEMRDGDDSLSFGATTESELLLDSITTISAEAYFSGDYLYSISNVVVLSSTGGRERAVISVTPSQALEAAKALKNNEYTYDYYEITGYISYIKSNGGYVYLSDTQEALDEEPNKSETFVIYRLENYIKNERLPVKTKIKITTTLTFYSAKYYQNGDVVSAEILEYAPTTDFYIQSYLKIAVGGTRHIDITPTPSYHVVHDVTFAWVDESQQIASIDENGVVTGLSVGSTTLAVSYVGITKNINIEVYETGSQTYQKCTAVEDYGIYLIASGNVFGKYQEGNTRIAFYEAEEGKDVNDLQLDEFFEWEIAKVVDGENNYYTIRNIGSGLYLNKGSNSVTYSNNIELWMIELLEDGTFEITNLEKYNAGEYNPHLRYNAGYGFGCYHSQLGITNTLYIKK